MTVHTMKSYCLGLLLFLHFPLAALLSAQTSAKQLESRAMAFEKQGKAQEALTAWKKAAALNPNAAVVQDHIGFLLAVLNRREEAIPYFVRAIELDQHFASAHYHLGVAYLIQRDPNRGIPELQAAVEAAPNNFDYRFYLGRSLNDTAH